MGYTCRTGSQAKSISSIVQYVHKACVCVSLSCLFLIMWFTLVPRTTCFLFLLLYIFIIRECMAVFVYIRRSAVLICVYSAWARTCKSPVATPSTAICSTWNAACQKLRNDSRGNAFHMFTIRHTVWSVICSPNMVSLMSFVWCNRAVRYNTK